MNKLSLVTVAIFAISVQNVCAAPLIYHGNNPNISPSASSFNATAIDTRAALTRPKEKTASTSGQTDAELVKRSALASVSSSISQQLTTGTGSGDVSFGDGSTAHYDTVNHVRTIKIHNLDGTETTISFPI